MDTPTERLAEIVWAEITKALTLEDMPLEHYRIVKEKRATFAQTPEQVKKRSGPQTYLVNLFVAGDWTATGLPATIEGSLRSGINGANVILDSL